jgi:cytochrome P450
MPREPKAYLHDMRQAAALIADFTEGLDFDAHAADAMVRAAVERQFEIIGEALGQPAKLDPAFHASGIRRVGLGQPRSADPHELRRRRRVEPGPAVREVVLDDPLASLERVSRARW